MTAEDLRRDTWSPMRAAADEVPFDISPVGLLDYSLNMSDNNAADILFDRLLAPAKVDSIVRNDYGAQKFAIGATEAMMHADTSTSRLNRATALDAAKFIYRFFTADTTASATLVKAVMAKRHLSDVNAYPRASKHPRRRYFTKPAQDLPHPTRR